MSIRFSRQDSENLITALNNNTKIADDIINRLSNGCDHLIKRLDSGELQGAAYTAGRGLFCQIVIPTVKKVQVAIKDIMAENKAYEYAHSVLAEYDLLDMDGLKGQLQAEQDYLEAVEAQIRRNNQFFYDAASISGGIVGVDYRASLALERVREHHDLIQVKAQVELQIDDTQTKINKLTWFLTEVNNYFADSLEVLKWAIKGVVELNSITVDIEGNFYVPDGIQLEALKAVGGVKIETKNSPIKMIEMLQEVYGFSKEVACAMQELMILMKMEKITASKEDFAAEVMIVFGSVSYGDTDFKRLQWQQATGKKVLSRTEFVKKLRKLGFSAAKANNLYEAIKEQHSLTSQGVPGFNDKPDFSHMMITGATELSNSSQLLANIAARGKTVQAGGWLGDTSTIGLEQPPSMSNDDYKADLDATNIAHRIVCESGVFEDTWRQYYDEIKNGKTNRTKEFKTHYKLQDIIDEINLVDNTRKETVVKRLARDIIGEDDGLLKESLNPTARKFVNSLEQDSNDYIDEEKK